MNFIYFVKEFFKKNAFGIFGIIVGILGTIYSVIESEKEREPAYFVTKNVGLFSSPQGLSSEYFAFIKRSDNSEVVNNVYLLEASFWNNGKEPIKSEDVLEPISINYSGEVEVIDAFIAQATRKNITKPEIKNDKENKNLLLNFRIIEKNDAIGIQVLYSAKKPADFHINGTIIGVKSILTKDDLADENLINGGIKTLVAILSVVGLIFAFVLSTKVIEFLIGKIHQKHEKAVSIIAGALSIGVVLLVVVGLGYAIVGGVLNNAEKSIIENIPKTEQVYPLKN